jgi:hypothetical protein
MSEFLDPMGISQFCAAPMPTSCDGAEGNGLIRHSLLRLG